MITIWKDDLRKFRNITKAGETSQTPAEQVADLELGHIRSQLRQPWYSPLSPWTYKTAHTAWTPCAASGIAVASFLVHQAYRSDSIENRPASTRHRCFLRVHRRARGVLLTEDRELLRGMYPASVVCFVTFHRGSWASSRATCSSASPPPPSSQWRSQRYAYGQPYMISYWVR